MKKLKSLLATLAMLLCTISASAEDFSVGGIYYNITDSENLTVEVTYQGSSYSDYSNEYTENVVIPETVTYDSNTYSVTSIGDSAFYACRSLTSVTIPNSVTSIGNNTFFLCTNLTSITIPNSVTSIGGSAFGNCSCLTSVTIPDGVTSIGERAFLYCTSLTSVTIPNSVTSIGERAFLNCTSLTSVTIPDGVTSIGDRAFYNCSSLTSVTIPNSVTTIGSYAFRKCSNLTSIAIGNGVTHIESDAFYDCSSLTSIVVDSENNVYDSRENCNAIIETKSNILITGCVKTVLTNSVTGIGDYAFRGCSGLSTINIPASITSIGKYAFESCVNLTSVYLNATSHVKINSSSTFGSSLVFVPSDLFDTYKTMEYWSEIYKNGKLLSNTDKLDYDVNVTAKPTTSDLLSEIKEADLHKVINLKISGSINSYDIIVLNQNMPNLRSLDLTNAKIVACDHEYYTGHKTLNDVIGDYMFYGQSKYLEIKLPKTVESIGNNAFCNCSSLTSVTIGNSVTTIGSEAFYACRSLTSVTIPDGVTSIGDRAFYNCSSLTSVTIPNSVTSIGYYAFNLCTSLISVTIPDGVTSIGSYTFSDCSSLASVTIGNGVTSIGDYAFYNCSSLTSVHISDIAAWCNIKFGYYYSNYYSNPLCYAEHLYMNGKEITELIIPNNVITIGSYAFEYCSSLTSVTIGDGVTSIGDYAFYNCSSLTEIKCKAEAPPTTQDFVFYGIDKTIPLYVPKGSVLKYKAAANWKDFVIIREIAETETDVHLTITDCANGNVMLKVDEDKPYFTLKIEAETGWHIHSVTFNDGDVTAELSSDGEYTTPAIGTDSRLNIVYAQGSSSGNSVSDSKIKVWASGNNIIVDNAILNETINVYTLDGMKITSVNANSNRVEIPLTTGVVYIVKVADKVLKVAL